MPDSANNGMATNAGGISSALAALHPELTWWLKPWKDFAGHQLQRSAHVGHRHAAEVDHADYVGDASLFIFPEDSFCLRWSSEDNQALPLELIEIGDLRSRAAVRLGE